MNVASLVAHRILLMRDCARQGHRFVEDDDGYHCSVCPVRVNGSKPPPSGGGSGERKTA